MLCCALVSRRSLSSSTSEHDPGVPPARRLGGARREASDRLIFTVGTKSIDGWALNVSHGGLRAIVDEAIDLGTEGQVAIADAAPRPCLIVWIQEEPDGAIVGVQYLDVRGSVPPPPSQPPSANDASGTPGDGESGPG